MPSARTTVSLGVAASVIIGTLVGGLSASIVSRLTPGSAIIQGDTVYVTNNNRLSSLSNTNPSVFVNSGAAVTYGTAGMLPGGGIQLSASGSRNLVANWLVPAKYASGGVLEAAYLECNFQPLRTTGSLVINQVSLKQSISNGTTIRNFIGIASGSLITVNTGALLNTKLFPGTYVSFITNSSGGAAIFGGAGVSPLRTDCDFKIRAHEKYGR